MDSNDLAAAAANSALSRADLESAAASLGVSLREVCDIVARDIAEGYLSGVYSWDFGDAAMNYLYSLAHVHSDFGMPDFAWRVFGAFDEGEYIHKGEPPELDGEPRTKALLETLLQTNA